MAEQIPFNIIADVLTKLGSSAIQQIGSAFGVAKELTKLTKKLTTIKGVLVDAEKRQEESDAVKAWVRRLKDVVYDADDLQVSDFFSSSNQLVFSFKMSSRVKNIKEEVDEIVKEMNLLNLVQGNITHSFVLTSEIVGREEIKEEIIKSLVSSDNQEILSMVAIVGIGGLGKTTLAQLVYNAKTVVQYFEPRIWVCVSDNFDVKSLVKKILKEVCEQDVDKLELNGLKNLLHEKISEKRCLLVLDDVWNENSEEWDRLKSLLMVVGKGSKILVTTRHSKVASIMGINSPFLLQGLKDTLAWDLFSKIAFTEEPKKVHPELVEMGKEIVNMCNGVPLVIKTLGTILRLKPEEMLRLSYNDLPIYLKPCFTYCALFPKDYEIEKNMLVQLWMAQGYIQTSDVGNQYFKELLSRSLLEVAKKDVYDNISSCKMHDLIHDLAQSIVGSENDGCGSLTYMPCRIGELTLLESLPLFVIGTGSKVGRLSELKRLNNLRGKLWIKKLENVRDANVESEEANLGEKQYIESLELEWSYGEEAQAQSGEDAESVMVGLRPHRNLKDWMMNGGLSCRLPNLSTINLKSCLGCQILPPFVELPHLKSLKLRHLAKVEYMDYYCSSGGPSFPSLEYLKLEYMPKLKELWRRDLSPTHPPSFPCLLDLQIHNCYRLASLELHSSPLLSKLEIKECDKLTSVLLPHSPLLSQLDIWYCGDLASLELHSSPLLSKLEIQYCRKLTSLRLPPSPLLSQLDVWNCGDLASLELHSSPLLSKLEIRGCRKMTSLRLPPSPILSQLDIVKCGDLASLELHSSPRLSNLTISDCPKLTSVQVSSLPCLKALDLLRVREEVLQQLLATAFSLESLFIFDIDDLMTLPDELHHVSTRQTLEIRACTHLATFPHWIGDLTSLNQLCIGSCHQLPSLPEEFRSLRILKSLTIDDWSGLTTLPDWIGSLSSLEHLQIRECPKLTSLPEEMRSLTTLHRLDIFKCPHLSERCQRENGEDWPKIAHVPDIIIDRNFIC
ncbi:hypothetical protein AAG906_029184 [Vitis piasezkii]